jgi:hypothetical protein
LTRGFRTVALDCRTNDVAGRVAKAWVEQECPQFALDVALCLPLEFRFHSIVSRVRFDYTDGGNTAVSGSFQIELLPTSKWIFQSLHFISSFPRSTSVCQCIQAAFSSSIQPFLMAQTRPRVSQQRTMPASHDEAVLPPVLTRTTTAAESDSSSTALPATSVNHGEEASSDTVMMMMMMMTRTTSIQRKITSAKQNKRRK